jgi:hypothetical protein
MRELAGRQVEAEVKVFLPFVRGSEVGWTLLLFEGWATARSFKIRMTVKEAIYE